MKLNLFSILVVIITTIFVSCSGSWNSNDKEKFNQKCLSFMFMYKLKMVDEGYLDFSASKNISEEQLCDCAAAYYQEVNFNADKAISDLLGLSVSGVAGLLKETDCKDNIKEVEF